MDDVDAVQVLHTAGDVAQVADPHQLRNVRRTRDLFECLERRELCHKAVIFVRDERPVELDCVRGVDLFEDVGLVVEVGHCHLIHKAELKKNVHVFVCHLGERNDLWFTFLIATSNVFL